MALSRHRRDSSIIWPGFVDAVTTLLMVMIFVLTIFTVMQSVLSEEITKQDTELAELSGQVSALSNALGLERRHTAQLEADMSKLEANLANVIAEGKRQTTVITQLEASVKDLEATKLRQISEAEAAALALAKAREEIDAQAEAARLAAARSETFEALIAELRTKSESDANALSAAQQALSEAEALRLADAAALEALRKRFENADAEIAAMTLNLEAERKRAEETLTLLAAERLATQNNQSDKDLALRNAEALLGTQKEEILAAARQVEALNQQLIALREQLGTLQAVLDDSEARRAEANIQLQSLGQDLNAALAQVASEQRARALLEEQERLRLEAENADLAKFRSEFFGQLSQLLAGREGIRVVGDRFVFSSEVLFNPGSAELAPEGKAQISSVVKILNDVRQAIPADLDWIIRVDGHTDTMPLSGQGMFKDNWELSQARALSVVRHMQQSLGFPPEHLAATGFGEYRPVSQGTTEADHAQNRRIELKLTER